MGRRPAAPWVGVADRNVFAPPEISSTGQGMQSVHRQRPAAPSSSRVGRPAAAAPPSDQRHPRSASRGAHSCRPVRFRTLPIPGRPTMLMSSNRLWRCREPARPQRDLSEASEAIGPGPVLTEPTRRWRCSGSTQTSQPHGVALWIGASARPATPSTFGPAPWRSTPASGP